MADEMVVDVAVGHDAEAPAADAGKGKAAAGKAKEPAKKASKGDSASKKKAPPAPAGKDKGKSKKKAADAGEKQPAAADADGDKSLQLPQARVRRIMRLDKDIGNVATDALVAITRSTELFLQAVSELSYREAKREKRKTVQYEDVAKVVHTYENLNFLLEIVPDRIKVRKAKERKLALEAAMSGGGGGGAAAAPASTGEDAPTAAANGAEPDGVLEMATDA